jgi:hypothetical protein
MSGRDAFDPARMLRLARSRGRVTMRKPTRHPDHLSPTMAARNAASGAEVFGQQLP